MSSVENQNMAERSLIREDSLEYFIKFPASQTFLHQHATENYAESDKIINEDVNVPIILLFGWAGCQDRYLTKYSKIYEDQGLITIRYTAPVENIFWKRDAMKPIGQKIVQLMYDMNFETSPVILHVFSNGGAYLYQHLDLAMKEFQTPLDLRGIIFDSSPGDRRLLSLYRAVCSIYGKNRRFNSVISWFITLGLAARWAFEDICQRIKGIFSPNFVLSANPYQNLKHLENGIPQMFLYSDTDKLIPQQDVKAFAEHRRRIGVPTEMIHFEGAEHVKLFLKYPKKYIHCVQVFVNNCLKNSPTLGGIKKTN